MKVGFNGYSIKFGATYITDSNVQKLDSNKKYKSEPVNFVEIDSKNYSDVQALGKISKYWPNSFYSSAFYDTALQKYKGNNYFNIYKLYALTSQQDHFEKLDDERILGLVEVVQPSKNTPKIFVSHIETNPQYLYSKDSEYTGIGSAMLESLQKLYYRIDLIARKSKTVSNFYIKNH